MSRMLLSRPGSVERSMQNAERGGKNTSLSLLLVSSLAAAASICLAWRQAKKDHVSTQAHFDWKNPRDIHAKIRRDDANPSKMFCSIESWIDTRSKNVRNP